MYIFYNKTRVGMYNGFVLAYARERGTDFSIGRDDRNFHKSTFQLLYQRSALLLLLLLLQRLKRLLNKEADSEIPHARQIQLGELVFCKHKFRRQLLQLFIILSFPVFPCVCIQKPGERERVGGELTFNIYANYFCRSSRLARERVDEKLKAFGERVGRRTR